MTPFWSKASYGQTNFRFTVLRNPNRSDGWFPPPKPLAVYSQGAWDIPSTVKHPEYYEPFVPAVTKDVVDTVCANASLAATLGCGPGATQFPRKFGRLIVMSNWADFGGQTIGSNYPYKIDTSTTHNWTPTATVANEDSFDRQMVEVVEHELGHQLGTDAHYGSNCSSWPPGSVADCLARWDIMSSTSGAAAQPSGHTRDRYGMQIGRAHV